MLRVALTNDAFIPIVDGVGRVVYEYASALGSRGHECYVVAPMSDAGYRAKYPFEIVDFQSIVVPGMRVRTGVASLDKHYMDRISTVQLDLVHAHSPGPAGMEAVRLASRQKVPLVGTFHSKFYDDFLRVTHSDSLATLGVKYVVDFFDRCDEVWTVSEFAAETLREYGYRGRLEIVQNGVNTDFPDLSREAGARLARQKYGLSDRVPVLLYVGQIDWKKNLRTIIEAAGLLYSAGWEFQLVFAGRGQDEEAAAELCQKYMPEDRFLFTGHITDTRMLGSLYYAADLFVFPSEYDTAGLVVREAALARTPSVVLRGSAPAEVVCDGENGFICENTPRSLCDTIAHALSDPARLEKLGSHARDTIPVSWETIMDDVIERYQGILERAAQLKRKRGLFRKELTAIDQTLEKRAMDMAWRFLKQDMQHIYAYDYYPQKAPAAPAASAALAAPGIPAAAAVLPRSTPERQGMHSAALLELYRLVDADEEARVQAMLVLRNAHVIAEGIWAPYERELPHQLYSMSKSVVSTAIGMLVDEGKLRLDERLMDLFRDKVDDPKTHPLRECSVWNLLTMSSGARFDEIGSALGVDWEQEFLDDGVRFEPGAQFHYNSMNTYMLSAIVRRKTGGSLMDYLRPRLFEPLGIKNAAWEVCPLGIEKGGWGLSLVLEDVAKIGLLYLQKGEYEVNGEMRRLVSREWIEEATRPQIETPNGECKDGYGYQIWMAPLPGSYLFNGAFGQYMMAIPSANMAVVIFSGSSRLFAQGELMRYVAASIVDAAAGPLPENDRAHRVLESALSMLSVRQRQHNMAMPMMAAPMRLLLEQLNGVSCDFDRNTSGIFPVVLQTVHNNYSPGIDSIAFKAGTDNNLYITIHEGETSNTLEFRQNAFCPGTALMRQETHAIRVGGQAGMLNSGDVVLQLFVYFVETPCTRILTAQFHDGEITLICDEDPSIRNAAAMLMELADVTQTEFLRSIMPLLKRERLQSRIRSYTTATIKGKVK